MKQKKKIFLLLTNNSWNAALNNEKKFFYKINVIFIIFTKCISVEFIFLLFSVNHRELPIMRMKPFPLTFENGRLLYAGYDKILSEDVIYNILDQISE